MSYAQILLLPLAFLLMQCSNNKTAENDVCSISELKFIGEQTLLNDKYLDEQLIGGFSGIDYANGLYYIISDASKAPIRFYTARLTFDRTRFSDAQILNQYELLDTTNHSFADKTADPEAIRFDPISNQLVWTSEGFAKSQINPFIRTADTSGQFIKEWNLPPLFQVDTLKKDSGIRHNGSFESLAISVDSQAYWLGMELPLKQDGEAPQPSSIEDQHSPVRISYINRNTGEISRQFVYELEPLKRLGDFAINGLVAILEYAPNQFLFLERSYASGHDDGGNDVLVFKVDASKATNVVNTKSLKNTTYTPTNKALLFDFNTIRLQLSDIPGSSGGVVDNIEGMTFGPRLSNGHQSLVFVADNNFCAFGPQLNQLIVFEVIP